MKKALILLVVLVLLAGLLFGLYHFLWTADNFAALGEKAMKSGNYARAVDRYTTAVSLAPDNVDYVLALADACLADGSYTRAGAHACGSHPHGPLGAALPPPERDLCGAGQAA